jgi:hypothetical protein
MPLSPTSQGVKYCEPVQHDSFGSFIWYNFDLLACWPTFIPHTPTNMRHLHYLLMQATFCMYLLLSILPDLCCPHFLLILLAFWPGGPHLRYYTNKYDAHWQYLPGGDYWYVLIAIHWLRTMSLTFCWFYLVDFDFWPSGMHTLQYFNNYDAPIVIAAWSQLQVHI